MKCISILFSIIVPYFWFNTFAKDMNKICVTTNGGEIPIDSIVVKRDEYFHVFINQTVLRVKTLGDPNTSVSDINGLFKTNGNTHTIESPIDISYTYLNESNDQILRLINLKIKKQWDIDFKSYEIIKSEEINVSEDNGIEVIDYLNINDTNGYKLYLDKKGEYIYVKKWHILDDKEDNEKYYLLSYKQNEEMVIVLSNDTNNREKIKQINGQNITSAVIFNSTDKKTPVLLLITKIEVAFVSPIIDKPLPRLKIVNWCYLKTVPQYYTLLEKYWKLIVALLVVGVVLVIAFFIIIAIIAKNKPKNVRKLSPKQKSMTMQKSMTIASEDKPLIGRLGEDIQWRLEVDTQSVDSQNSVYSKRSVGQSEESDTKPDSQDIDRKKKKEKPKKTIESEKTLKLVPRKH